MMWTLIVILVGLWIVAKIASFTLGGLIHLLLVAAVIMLIVRLVRGPGKVE